jgi:hypothetical protein
MSAARMPWSPWMAWMDVAASVSEMMVSSAQVVAQRGARMAGASVPPSARDQKEFTLMGAEKMQAAGESMLAMFSPLSADAGSLGLKLAELGWRQMQRNAHLLQNWSPLSFGTMQSWSAAPAAASTKAMNELLRQGNYVRASAQDAARTAGHARGAASRTVKRGIKPVKSRVKANARRLAKG